MAGPLRLVKGLFGHLFGFAHGWIGEHAAGHDRGCCLVSRHVLHLKELEFRVEVEGQRVAVHLIRVQGGGQHVGQLRGVRDLVV